MARKRLEVFLALLGGGRGLWLCSPSHTAAGGRVSTSPAGQLEHWGPGPPRWTGKLNGTGGECVWEARPGTLSGATSPSSADQQP